MEKAQAIDRIKKLLAMSSDGAASENEREMALRHAQRLMAEFCVEQSHLTDQPELIERRQLVIKPNNPLPVYLQHPMILQQLCNTIATNFGCYTYVLKMKVPEQWIMGFKSNIEIAEYAINTLIDQGISDFRAQYKTHKTIGFGNAFWRGFVEGIAQRFLKLSDSTALQLYDKVKAEFEKNVNFVTYEMDHGTAQGFDSGKESAKNAQLNPAITKSEGKQLR